MEFKDKAETYLLLRLERYAVELRRGKWLGREASGRILKWIDARLTRQSALATQRATRQEQKKAAL